MFRVQLLLLLVVESESEELGSLSCDVDQVFLAREERRKTKKRDRGSVQGGLGKGVVAWCVCVWFHQVFFFTKEERNAMRKKEKFQSRDCVASSIASHEGVSWRVEDT
jgi:hypothetical protein